MADWLDGEGTQLRVVVNHEEQYSIWPVDRELPQGWVAEGMVGSKQECLDHIEEVWTDMRPRSVRELAREQDAASAGVTVAESTAPQRSSGGADDES